MGGCRALAGTQLHNKEATNIEEAPLPLAFLYQYSSIVVSTLDKTINRLPPPLPHPLPPRSYTSWIPASDTNTGSRKKNNFPHELKNRKQLPWGFCFIHCIIQGFAVQIKKQKPSIQTGHFGCERWHFSANN